MHSDFTTKQSNAIQVAMEKAEISSQSFGNSIETGTLWKKSGL
ncbi:hypothetical protein A2U01_0093123, partial [Trifolium medium]|nr:hypothetical protein [Trifolium medium]